ncbi:hypothetical protein [Paenibacillus ginsengihumi]|nr:hypothetical protein [Paenibacillus ginsengihumi]
MPWRQRTGVRCKPVYGQSELVLEPEGEREGDFGVWTRAAAATE